MNPSVAKHLSIEVSKTTIDYNQALKYLVFRGFFVSGRPQLSTQIHNKLLVVLLVCSFNAVGI